MAGRGASGIGAYHRVHGFRRVSHMRSMVVQEFTGASGAGLRALYAEKLIAIERGLGGTN